MSNSSTSSNVFGVAKAKAREMEERERGERVKRNLNWSFVPPVRERWEDCANCDKMEIYYKNDNVCGGICDACQKIEQEYRCCECEVILAEKDEKYWCDCREEWICDDCLPKAVKCDKADCDACHEPDKKYNHTLIKETGKLVCDECLPESYNK